MTKSKINSLITGKHVVCLASLLFQGKYDATAWDGAIQFVV